MTSYPLLFVLEFKKVARNSKTLLLPVLFYLLAFVMMICFVPMTSETSSFLRIYLWVLVSLSLKLSFGSFLHEDAEHTFIHMLIAQGYQISHLLLFRVLISTLIFSGLFLGIFLGLVLLHLLVIQDLLVVPVFIGSLLFLQVGVELLTLNAKPTRCLCYLLLLPLETPLLILVISQTYLSSIQLLETLVGILFLSIGIFLFLGAFVFHRNRIT